MCVTIDVKAYLKLCCISVVSRVVFDRGYTEWDEGLTSMNVDCDTMTPDSTSDYVRHIRHNSM